MPVSSQGAPSWATTPAGFLRAWAHSPERYSRVMADRRAYPSDLSDARWELIEPVLAAWRSERRRPGPGLRPPARHDLREIMNAILYVDRTGVQWRTCRTTSRTWKPSTATSPSGRRTASSPSSTACYGVGPPAGGQARRPVGLRDRRTEREDLHQRPAAGPGHDAAKKIVGRKRSIVTDTLGLLLAVLVTAASVQDSIAGTHLLEQVAADHPSHPQGLGGRRLPQAPHRARRRPRHRHGNRPTQPPGPEDSPRFPSAGQWSGPTAG